MAYKVFQAKTKSIPGTDFREVHKKAMAMFIQIKKQSKRRTYVRSAYFDKDKIFLDILWSHLFGKANWRDRVRRIKYFPPAMELIKHSKFKPKTKENPNKAGEIFHRFSGITTNSELFHIQIKEHIKNRTKISYVDFP